MPTCRYQASCATQRLGRKRECVCGRKALVHPSCGERFDHTVNKSRPASRQRGDGVDLRFLHFDEHPYAAENLLRCGYVVVRRARAARERRGTFADSRWKIRHHPHNPRVRERFHRCNANSRRQRDHKFPRERGTDFTQHRDDHGWFYAHENCVRAARDVGIVRGRRDPSLNSQLFPQCRFRLARENLSRRAKIRLEQAANDRAREVPGADYAESIRL